MWRHASWGLLLVLCGPGLLTAGDDRVFPTNGAKLDATSKKRVAEINQKLAALYTTFNQNVLAEEGTQMVLLDAEADLAGLPPSLRDGLASAAESRAKKGKWAVVNTRSSDQSSCASSGMNSTKRTSIPFSRPKRTSGITSGSVSPFTATALSLIDS